MQPRLGLLVAVSSRPDSGHMWPELSLKTSRDEPPWLFVIGDSTQRELVTAATLLLLQDYTIATSEHRPHGRCAPPPFVRQHGDWDFAAPSPDAMGTSAFISFRFLRGADQAKWRHVISSFHSTFSYTDAASGNTTGLQWGAWHCNCTNRQFVEEPTLLAELRDRQAPTVLLLHLGWMLPRHAMSNQHYEQPSATAEQSMREYAASLSAMFGTVASDPRLRAHATRIVWRDSYCLPWYTWPRGPQRTVGTRDYFACCSHNDLLRSLVGASHPLLRDDEPDAAELERGLPPVIQLLEVNRALERSHFSVLDAHIGHVGVDVNVEVAKAFLASVMPAPPTPPPSPSPLANASGEPEWRFPVREALSRSVAAGGSQWAVRARAELQHAGVFCADEVPPVIY